MNDFSNIDYDSINLLFNQEPYQSNADDKKILFNKALYESFRHHIKNNKLFRTFCENQNFDFNKMPEDLSEYPYLPVNIFKNRDLSSVSEKNINGILSSSATSGIPSRIVLDSITSRRQTMISAKVMSSYLGSKRRPYFVLDEDPLKSNAVEISARSAATRGFLILSSNPEYFLFQSGDHLNFDLNKFESFAEKNQNLEQEICIFGFTYILYSNVIQELLKKGVKFKLPKNSKVAHIGGWKKLESQKVSKEKFILDVSSVFGIDESNIFDFYGFTEQMGLLYVSAGHSPKIVPIYSEIIIRDFQTLEPVDDGKEGLIQILTPLPNSYPGISVLTEDVGVIKNRGIDKFGRNGTQFEIIGRAKEAEVRGCGDIMSDYVA